MDPLELVYEKLDAVPEAFRGLYTEKDGKAVLTHINGMKTPQDVANVQEALRKEREDHGAAKLSLKAWGALKPDEVQSKLDRMAELEAAAGGKLDEAAMQKIIDARLGQKTAPLERQLRDLTAERDTLQTEVGTLRGGMERRDMTDVVRAVATEMKVLGTAIPDVEMVASMYLERDATTGAFIVKADAKGVTPGTDVKGFLKDMQKIRPHWWPASQGGGAGGGGFGGDNGENPWSAKGWNLTAQGKYVQENGLAKAQQAAAAVGSKVGATRPPVTAK